MSNSDSFVDEVSEELRRDRASRLLRRWGWLAIVAVVAIVGAAAFVEWRAASSDARARAFGDALLAALDAPEAARADAIAAVPAADGGQAVVRALLRASALDAAGDGAGAVALLVEVAELPELDRRHRHLALARAMASGGTGDAARDASILEELAAPGAPFRPLAVEMQAMVAVADGDLDAATGTLLTLVEEAGVAEPTRRRARQALVALGAPLDAS